MTMSRRDLFVRWFRHENYGRLAGPPSGLRKTARQQSAQAAVVQGRFCLAYQRSFCSVCSERCPVEGAIQVELGIPRINPAICTGCGICQQVCPAPRNAILMIPKPQPIPANKQPASIF
jgi:Pyruvate/2-oxoacid:ferredoxin oxidoreductase delta subunit